MINSYYIGIAKHISGVQMDSTTLYLIRHGQTDWNLAGKMQGQTDIPLNATGIGQAQRVAHSLKNKQISLAALYSSDLQRAHQTAQEIAKILSLDITLASDLREGYFGKLEGLTKKEAQDLFGSYHYEDMPPEIGAEPRDKLISRVMNYLTYVAHAHSGKQVAIITHGAVLGSIINHLGHNLEKLPELTNQSITTFTWHADRQLFVFESIEHV